MGLARKRGYPIFEPPKFNDGAAARLGYSVDWDGRELRLEKDVDEWVMIVFTWTHRKGWDAYVWRPFIRRSGDLQYIIKALAMMDEHRKELGITWKHH